MRELDPQTLPISCALPLSETAVSAVEVGPEDRGICLSVTRDAMCVTSRKRPRNRFMRTLILKR
jgi:hypothetical protein